MNVSLIFRTIQTNTTRSRFILIGKHLNLNLRTIFSGTKDRFKGITVDTSKEKCSPTSFPSKLEESLKKWSSDGNTCIWFKVNIKDASIVPALAKQGFNFHHARDDFVMMYKWLPRDTEPNLPPASHTNLGVGAMVVNGKRQLLAISEKHFEYPHWKLPGGYVGKGEDIVAAAVREVKEETGVDASFLSLITFRHTHKAMFGNSDIYVLLLLKPLSENITISERELIHCKWMDIEEYTSHPHVHEFNRLVVSMALENRTKKLKLDITKKTVKWAKFTREMTFLYLKNVDY